MSEEETELYNILIERGLNKDDAKNIVKEFYEKINKKEDTED